MGRNKCLFSGVRTRMGCVLHSHSASLPECGWFKLIAVALNPAFSALSFVLPSLLCLLLPPPQTLSLQTHPFEKETQHFINLGACWIAKDKLCRGPRLIRTTRQSRSTETSALVLPLVLCIIGRMVISSLCSSSSLSLVLFVPHTPSECLLGVR